MTERERARREPILWLCLSHTTGVDYSSVSFVEALYQIKSPLKLALSPLVSLSTQQTWLLLPFNTSNGAALRLYPNTTSSLLPLTLTDKLPALSHGFTMSSRRSPLVSRQTRAERELHCQRLAG